MMTVGVDLKAKCTQGTEAMSKLVLNHADLPKCFDAGLMIFLLLFTTIWFIKSLLIVAYKDLDLAKAVVEHRGPPVDTSNRTFPTTSLMIKQAR